MKTCTKCGVQKKEIKFYFTAHVRKDGTKKLGSECKECKNKRVRQSEKRHPERAKKKSREYYERKRLYIACRTSGTLSELDMVAKSFSGFCHVCGVGESKRRLHLDHDHNTGQFRGWLCSNCNFAAGHLMDNPEIALKLAEYLEFHSSVTTEERFP
jgi:hypothetical protein